MVCKRKDDLDSKAGNTIYKWFTSCLLQPMDQHLRGYGLMEEQQRGAKSGCCGTVDNLLIDQMVTKDCHRNKRNLSMAWVDVKKAYDSVDYGWLVEMMHMHKFPRWLFAWKLKATEGYRLSKPNNMLYIDDLKVFAASESKPGSVLKRIRSAMSDIGLE
ncbi:uncharacterized protein [Montipora capricornis]|uniref:uncharacterized protein n=1 Tax=Montipora capricornis TaxID=246305 RepID=UPI0035F1FEAE